MLFFPEPKKNGTLFFFQGGPGSPRIYPLPVDLGDPERTKAGKAEPFLVDAKLVEVDPTFSPDG
jgi:hypothetical protein